MSKTRWTIRIGLAAAALGLVAVCGSPPPKAPKPRAVDAAPVVVTPSDAAPALAGVRLCEMLVERTRAETEDVKPETLAVVAAHCPRWPEPVQQCLATADEQGPCMRELDPDQRKAFVTEIGKTMVKAPTCEEISADPGRWVAIPKAAVGEARQRVALAIGDVIAASCAAWPESVRQCTRDQQGSPRTCLDADVPPEVGAGLDAALARRAEVWKRAARYSSRDRKIKCKKVADAHYGRGGWIGKLADRTGAERKRAMTRSEEALEDACKDERWSSFVRGCVIAADSENERGWCIDTEKRWAYPAAGTLPAGKKPAGSTGSTGSTAFPGCDDYVRVVEKYVACTEVTAGERAAAQSDLEMMTLARKRAESAPPDAKEQQSAACKTAADTIRTRLSAAGCDL